MVDCSKRNTSNILDFTMTSNGDTVRHEVPATKALTSFIAQANASELTTELREKVKEVLVDYCGVVSKQPTIRILG